MKRAELEAIAARARVAADEYDRGDAVSAYQRIRGDLHALLAELDPTVECADCLNATGGACRAHQQPECTCYELAGGGHQPGCGFYRG